MAQMTLIQAITNALEIELGKDDRTLVFGEDVGANGGVFRATEGLQEKFGEDRVFNTPLAESGIGGLAVGLTFENFRPILRFRIRSYGLNRRTSSAYSLPYRWITHYANYNPFTIWWGSCDTRNARGLIRRSNCTISWY